jgi:hypothetical protein
MRKLLMLPIRLSCIRIWGTTDQLVELTDVKSFSPGRDRSGDRLYDESIWFWQPRNDFLARKPATAEPNALISDLAIHMGVPSFLPLFRPRYTLFSECLSIRLRSYRAFNVVIWNFWLNYCESTIKPWSIFLQFQYKRLFPGNNPWIFFRSLDYSHSWAEI